MSTDRAVILRSLEDPEAFGELFDRHAPAIHRFAARRVDASAANDIVAETFLRAFERRERFAADREDALPWLFGFAVNVMRQWRRTELRFVPDEVERVDESDGVAAVGRRVDAERQLRAVVEAVRRMPKGPRDVVTLHLLAELSYEDVAVALGIPVGTVRSRLNRAREKLRALPELSDYTNGETHGTRTALPHLPQA